MWPGEEGGWDQLGQSQRHLVGGGVNHLGGRWGGVGCGFGGPGDPCGEGAQCSFSTFIVETASLEMPSPGLWVVFFFGGTGVAWDRWFPYEGRVCLAVKTTWSVGAGERAPVGAQKRV